jgi:hypothetical protein
MRIPRSVGKVLHGCLLSVTLVGVMLAGSAFAVQTPTRSAAKATTTAAPQQAILPQSFGGWQIQGQAQTSTDPSSADPTNAAVLKEYRLTDVSAATYTREDGRTLKIRAARFADASGAFGAYTFYLQPEMSKEQIGDQAASLEQRVLFYRGHVLVDASFSRESVMSGAELRELAGLLPRPSGGDAALPTFIEFMPRRGYITNTQKYVMGPAALAALAPPVAADLVDFGVNTEVSLGRYDTSSGEATLMLISYPNSQIAAEHLRRIDAAHQRSQQQSGVSTVENIGPFFDKRSGPIVAIAAGPVSDSDAKELLGMVNYEARVTWQMPTSDPQVRDLYQLILNIVVLCAILGGLAVVAGVAFGGVRILMKRLYPDKIFDRPEQMEFISLHLTETVVKGMPPAASDGSHQAPQNPA